MNKIIDMETYFYPQTLLAYFAGRSEYPQWNPEQQQMELSAACSLNNPKYIAKMQEDFGARIAQMDANGIEKALLCVELGLHMVKDAVDDVVAQTKLANDAIYAATQAYPNRFFGVAVVQSLDIPKAVAELEHCVKDYGFVGCQVFSDYSNMAPDNEAFWPIFEKAAELNVPVFLHTVIPQMGRIVEFGSQMYALGRGNDTVITMARLIAKGVFECYPNLKVVLGNFGELLPFVMERMDHYTELFPDKKAPAANQYPFRYYFKNNIWVTTSGICSEPMLNCAYEILGADRIMLSTNYPTVAMDKTAVFVQNANLSEADKEKVAYANACKVLNI